MKSQTSVDVIIGIRQERYWPYKVQEVQYRTRNLVLMVLSCPLHGVGKQQYICPVGFTPSSTFPPPVSSHGTFQSLEIYKWSNPYRSAIVHCQSMEVVWRTSELNEAIMQVLQKRELAKPYLYILQNSWFPQDFHQWSIIAPVCHHIYIKSGRIFPYLHLQTVGALQT